MYLRAEAKVNHAGGFIWVWLGYALHPVLDGIINSDDVALLVVEFS